MPSNQNEIREENAEIENDENEQQNHQEKRKKEAFEKVKVAIRNTADSGEKYSAAVKDNEKEEKDGETVIVEDQEVNGDDGNEEKDYDQNENKDDNEDDDDKGKTEKDSDDEEDENENEDDKIEEKDWCKDSKVEDNDDKDEVDKVEEKDDEEEGTEMGEDNGEKEKHVSDAGDNDGEGEGIESDTRASEGEKRHEKVGKELVSKVSAESIVEELVEEKLSKDQGEIGEDCDTIFQKVGDKENCEKGNEGTGAEGKGALLIAGEPEESDADETKLSVAKEALAADVDYAEKQQDGEGGRIDNSNADNVLDGKGTMQTESRRGEFSECRPENGLEHEPSKDDIEMRDVGGKNTAEEDKMIAEEKKEEGENGNLHLDGVEDSENPRKRKRESLPDEEEPDLNELPPVPLDPEIIKQQGIIDSTPRNTELEHALYDVLKRKEAQVDRLTGEITKLKAFISKRKQTYKRKRKDSGAPTRALSAYNIFVQDRFSKLAKENEQALKSSDTDAQLKRVPPASLVASTGPQWKELSAEEKAHYEERAREDRKRYEEQMAKYQPPDKQANRKRNKTGYNMFFSAHVLRLKQSEAGVPSERGSVARLVGNAWKQLSSEEKQFYEREADKMNGMNPVEKEEEEDDGEEKRPQIPEYPPNYPVQHGEMHMHAGMPPPMHGHAQHPGQHDPRQHAHYYPPNYAYGQPTYHGYHDQTAQGQHRHYQGRAHAHYQYPPPHGHPYDQRGMGM